MLRSELGIMVKLPSNEIKRVIETLDCGLYEQLEIYCERDRLSLSQGIARSLETFFNETERKPLAFELHRQAASS